MGCCLLLDLFWWRAEEFVSKQYFYIFQSFSMKTEVEENIILMASITDTKKFTGNT